MKRLRTRGLALGTVLVLTLLVAALALTVAALCVSHLTLISRADQKDQALNMARNLVRIGVASVLEKPSFGTQGESLKLDPDPADPGASTLLTFDASTAAQNGVPLSQNRIGATQSAASAPGTRAQVVPADAVHLVAVARLASGIQALVEAVVTCPAFPQAVATNGPLATSGGVTVAGLSSFPAAGVVPSPDARADLRCNAPDPQAVFLDLGTSIQGNLSSVGGVNSKVTPQIGGTAPADPAHAVWIEGQLKSGVAAQPLMTLDVKTLDPGSTAGNLTSGAGNATLSVAGSSLRTTGDLACQQGLKLDGGTLYVEGNLSVKGGIQGTGRVVCTGNLTLEGNTAISSGNGVAVLAGGQVSLTGSGSSGSYFQGLVYAGQGVSFDAVTVVGAVVSPGTQPVTLHEANLMLPAPLAQQGLLSPAGGGGSVDPSTTLAVYVDAGQNTVNNASWAQASLYQKHTRASGDYYTVTTFTKTAGGQVSQAGAPVEVSVAQATMSGGFSANALQALQVTPDQPPPPPPVDPQHPGGAALTVPSQFLRLQEHLRVAFWAES